MNTLKRILLTLALGAGFSTTALLADPAGSTAGEHTDKKPRVSRVEKLSAELNLTEEQKTQIAAIYKEENAALKVVSEDKSLDRHAKIEKNKEIRAAHAAKARAVLNPEQQTKFDSLAAKASADKDKPQHDERS